MAADRITGKAFTTRSEVFAQHGMVATSQPLATQVGLDILKAGGAAVDAAIAVNACLGLMEPTGGGVGGDLFAIVWDARERRLYGLNASGRSPQSLTREVFAEKGLEQIPTTGPLSVSVPGCVDGWFELHGKFGRLPMTDVLAPAIRYAEEGFPVSELIAFYWDRSVPGRAKYPRFLETFTVDGKRAPRKGEIWKNPALADTYQKIATGGRDAFYKGDIARQIGAYMQENGGYLSYEDLAAHDSEWLEPVSTNYRGYDVWELPPNGQGIAALQILNILEAYDLAAFGFGSIEHLHLFTEAKKLAYEDRAKFYADPAFAEVPVARLISKEYAAERREHISMKRAARDVQPGPAILQKGDTVYFCVADAEGNMVSMIQSNFWGMGSGMCPTGLGFQLQNRGTSFSLDPDHMNTLEPGKRPFHTIIPAFVTKDGEPWLAFGVMGGAMQPQGHAQILMNLIDFGMDLQAAGDAPRVQHFGSSEPTGESMMEKGGYLAVESGFDPEVLRQLQLMGHDLRLDVGGYGGYQAIARDPESGVYAGASESRKDGQAAGY